MTAKQREQRLVKLTLSEMASLPEDAVVYEGVGKMYAPCYAPCSRSCPRPRTGVGVCADRCRILGLRLYP